MRFFPIQSPFAPLAPPDELAIWGIWRFGPPGAEGTVLGRYYDAEGRTLIACFTSTVVEALAVWNLLTSQSHSYAPAEDYAVCRVTKYAAT